MNRSWNRFIYVQKYFCNLISLVFFVHYVWKTFYTKNIQQHQNMNIQQKLHIFYIQLEVSLTFAWQSSTEFYHPLPNFTSCTSNLYLEHKPEWKEWQKNPCVLPFWKGKRKSDVLYACVESTHLTLRSIKQLPRLRRNKTCTEWHFCLFLICYALINDCWCNTGENILEWKMLEIEDLSEDIIAVGSRQKEEYCWWLT